MEVFTMKKFFGFFSLFFFSSVLLFLQFFISGEMPYPGNFMYAWFEPWKSDYVIDGVITLSHKPIADDIFRQLYPMKVLGMDLVKTMQPPLWNPYNGAGMPLLATLNIGFFDPLNILYFIFPNWLAWSLAIVMQPVLIISATFLYLRKMKLSLVSSFFGSVVFLLSGSVIVRFVYGIFGLAICVLPFLLYLFESYIQDNKTKKIWIIPIAVFSLIVATQPQISMYILLFVIFYILYRLLMSKKVKKEMPFLMMLIMIGVGMSAVQVIPTLELISFANLNANSSEFIFDRFLLDFYHFITLVIPNYFGNIGTYNYWEPKGDYIETVLYIGTIPIFFALFSVSKRKNEYFSIVPFMVCVVVFSFVATLRSPFSENFFKLPIPILSTGIPTRIFLLSSFAVSILAAIGFERLCKEKKSLGGFVKMSMPLVCIYLGIVIFTIWSVVQNYWCPSSIENCRTVALRNTFFEIGIFFIAYFLLLFSIAIKKRMVVALQIGIVGLVIFSGVYNSYKFQPFSKKETFLPKNTLISFLSLQKSRVFGFDDARIDTNFATFFRFYDPDYYHPLYIRRYGELVSFANTSQYPSKLLRSDVNITSDSTIKSQKETNRKRLLNLLGVEFFIYKNTAFLPYGKTPVWQNAHFVVIRNNDTLPKAYFVDEVLVKKDEKEILSTLFSSQFHPKTQAIVEKEIPGFAKKSSSFDKWIKIKSYHENSVHLDAYASQDSFLVFSDNYYPGWNAYIDSQYTPVMRTNYTLRGMVVPKGRHEITFIYQPLSFYFGLGVSIICVLFWVLLLLYLRWKITLGIHPVFNFIKNFSSWRGIHFFSRNNSSK